MRGIEILKKPIFWLILSAILLWAGVLSLPDNRLHLVFCDVGQGDAILISYKQTQVLIDGGPDNKVLSCLSKNIPFWDRTLEMVILTHPEADHFSGLIDVIKRYNVKQFVSNSLVNDSAGFREFYQTVLAEKVNVYSPQAGDRLKIGPIELLVLWPKEKLGNQKPWLGKLNETSIVFELSFGNFDSLFTGDIDFDVEKQVNLSRQKGEIEILKIAHHGSKYSTGEEFLKKIKPQLAVISVGKNSFGHPTKEVIEKLRDLDIKILRTDQEGEIKIVSDGKNWYTTK